MILPQTSTGALVMMILCLLCLGSWANFYKLAGKWRYEFFYVDFALGLTIAAGIAALTLGSLGFDGFSFMDDLFHAGKRQWLFAFMAGAVFNLGNMLIVAAVSVAGMAVAFPVGMGLTLIVALWIGKLNGAPMSAGLLGLGSASILAALIFDGVVYRSVMKTRRADLLADNKKRAARSATAVKGLILSAVGGLIMAGTYPLLGRATLPDIGLGPYSLTALFSFGILLSTAVYSIFFMNLPVAGEPAILGDYLKARPTLHVWGLLGGFVWCGGTLANWVAGSVPQEMQVSKATTLVLSQGGILLAAIWGIAAWKDFRTASGVGKTMAFLMLVLMACGLALLSLSLGSGTKA